MYNKKYALYQQVIKEYFDNRLSLRKVAAKYGLHYQTVYQWVKKYKADGNNYSFLEWKSPWNRTKVELERKIIMVREKFPWWPVNQLQTFLAKHGFKLSYHCIWEILKRYGYSGFNLHKISSDFTDFVPFTKESRTKFSIAEKLYQNGKINESAKILNTIPCLPKNDLILKIPDELLSLQHRIEKLANQFGRINIAEYLIKAQKLYQECHRKHLNYSALRIGIALLTALSWQAKPDEMVAWIKKIHKLVPCGLRKSKTLFPIYFTLQLINSHILISQMKVKKAFAIARRCLYLISHHKQPPPNFLYSLAITFIDLEEYDTAGQLLMRALNEVDKERKKRIKTLLAIFIYLLRGDKKNAEKNFRQAEIYDWAKEAQLSRFRSLFALIEGKPSEAFDLAQKALNASKGTGLFLDIANAYGAMASSYMCLGEIKKGKSLLNELKKFLKKTKMKRQLLVTDVLLHKIPKNKEVLKLSSIKLAWLLKNKGYITAYRFALKKGILFYFYRYLFFYPEIVQKRILKNKPTYLPKTILRLPIFNTETNVYRINLLGRITIFLNQKYLMVHLTPKDTALLLYIANRLPEPQQSLSLTALYNNFWSKSQNSARIFSHSLVRIKKGLKIPGHYLEIRRQGGESFLFNQNLYFTTDYQEFEQTLARAKALERAGEWNFARKEYLRAFRLFRGEPFKKNFDDWSVNMRFRILSQFETEAIAFAKSCLEHKNLSDAKKILQKVLKIIADSKEIKNLLTELNEKINH